MYPAIICTTGWMLKLNPVIANWAPKNRTQAGERTTVARRKLLICVSRESIEPELATYHHGKVDPDTYTKIIPTIRENIKTRPYHQFGQSSYANISL